MISDAVAEPSLLQLIVAYGHESDIGLLSLREKLHGVGARCEAASCIPFSELNRALATSRPDALILYCHEALKNARHYLSEATRLGIPAIVVGPHTESSVMIDLLRNGAEDYINYETDNEQLMQRLGETFQRIALRRESNYAQGQLHCILSAQPGTGVTTIAAGLAFALAGGSPGRVSLTELGASTPQLALILDQHPDSTLSSIARRSHLLDATLVRQAMVSHSAGVELLLEAPGSLQSTELSAEQVRQLMTLFRVTYQHSILDLSNQRTTGNLEAIRISDSVFVVCRLDVPGIHLTQRLLGELLQRGVSTSRIKLIFNRQGERGTLDSRSAADALGMSPTGVLVNSPAQVNASRNRGVPLKQISRFSSITRELARIASQIASPR